MLSVICIRFTLLIFLLGICGSVSSAPQSFAYIPDTNTGHAILQFRVQHNGKWTPLTPASVPIHGNAGAITTHHEFVYAADCAYAYIAQFRIGKNGQLHPLNPYSVQADSHPTDIVIHPNGRFAYVSCSHGSVCQYRISANGSLKGLQPFRIFVSKFGERDPSPVQFDTSGNFAYIITQSDDGTGSNTIYQYRIAPNGTLNLIARHALGDSLDTNSLAFSNK